MSDWNRHISTAKHANLEGFRRQNYACIKCNFTCDHKSSWDKHITTQKHRRNNSAENLGYEITPQHICSICNLTFDKYKKLWYHKRKCSENKTEDTKKIEISTDLLQELILENRELRNFIIEKTNEQNDKLIELSSKSTNIITNTNSNNTINNKFNLNFFLNEQCKDAMNLMDFVKNIQITNEDIENNGQLGFVGGISKIFLDNLKQLSIYERPIHCTDVKRETMYIKSDDRWQKEEDKTKLQKAITEVSRKSVAKINQWKTETPEYENMDSPEFTQGIVMSNNSMAGYNREEYADKIIRLLAKETMVDKNNLLL